MPSGETHIWEWGVILLTLKVCFSGVKDLLRTCIFRREMTTYLLSKMTPRITRQSAFTRLHTYGASQKSPSKRTANKKPGTQGLQNSISPLIGGCWRHSLSAHWSFM